VGKDGETMTDTKGFTIILDANDPNLIPADQDTPVSDVPVHTPTWIDFTITPNGDGWFEARLISDGDAYLAAMFEDELEAERWVSLHLTAQARIRTECAECGDVLVDIPEDDRGISHGFCEDCADAYRRRHNLIAAER
jgi:hypothetical protein